MSHEAPFNPHLIEVRKRPTLRSALLQLQEAYELASSENRPIEEFAIRLSSLILGGSSAPAVQWLLNGGYVQQVLDIRSRRLEKSLANGSLLDRSCLVATVSGQALARALNAQPKVRSEPVRGGKPLKPAWNKETSELRVGAQVVKCYTRPAPNQFLILQTLQELKWKPHADDPLPVSGDLDPRKRLTNTVQRLNRGQINPLIRFHVDSNGKGIRWEFRSSGSPKTNRRN
jgi:hypothetical protein